MKFWVSSFATFLLANSVYADGPAPGQPSMSGQLIMIGLFIAIFYFMLWRPQNKRAKEHRNLVNGLAKGDEVVTNGGLIGRISRVTDNFLVISLSDNVEVTIQRQAITMALPKGTMKSI